MMHNLDRCEPVAVGGVGGSGTRLLMKVLAELGYFMGSDLNLAGDNLSYTLLFRRVDILKAPHDELEILIGLFIDSMVEGRRFSPLERLLIKALGEIERPPLHQVAWLRARAEHLLGAAARPASEPGARWGWKEPNTYVLLEPLSRLLPRMRYIHVARNGLDMAYSSNQNQLRFWGSALLGVPDVPVDAYHSLKFWCHVHRRVLATGARMDGRFLLLNFDDLCADPPRSLSALCQFLGVADSPELVDRLVQHVVPPTSMGRFKAHSLDAFDPDDVTYVARLGFNTR